MKRSLEEVGVGLLLLQVLALGACELHLEVGRPPIIRREGDSIARELDYEAARPHHVQAMVYDILSDEQIQRFESDLFLTFRHGLTSWPGRPVWEFNGLAVRDRGHIAASFRLAD